ncbi:unnamed protein product [Protopolystoma xenopodis]|uniref:Uncharacterized protein n=1 Tax=Protopolystoma xenopodis TaxID=117903 RepID=A0A448XB68_9PLAT|nr:unnamed protein product [Protopolystoma xenopodis]
MAILTDDADYDGGETFWNVPRPRFNFGTDHGDTGLRTRCVPLSLPTNMIMLRKQGQATSIEINGGRKLINGYLCLIERLKELEGIEPPSKRRLGTSAE